ncbi:MAG TPA: hypothetical protein VLC46_20240 [Thermoanaerobaculia bacterium]|nr:hypothetical protein [Thermoanaerobaculia bacterium]
MALAIVQFLFVAMGWVRWEDPMLTPEMSSEYERMFASCNTNMNRRPEADEIITRMMKFRDRYEAVSRPTGVPWYVIATIHNMECDGRFDCHLHNGDPLTARTVDVPAGRPISGNPPFTWEESAIDALRFEGFDVMRNWDVAHTLYKIEAYNGFGSRQHGVPTPYLWAGSQHYVRGKFVADHQFDPHAVSEEIGAAVLLHRMSYEHLIDFPPGTAPAAPAAPSGGQQ